jgi:predicted nucleic acid-binding protein
MARKNLYKPKWTDEILNEWIQNLLKNRPDLKALNLNRTKILMNTTFAYANVSEYEMLIGSLSLPDSDDRHILAAAIKSGADFIVTYNLKDFPRRSCHNSASRQFPRTNLFKGLLQKINKQFTKH